MLSGVSTAQLLIVCITAFAIVTAIVHRGPMNDVAPEPHVFDALNPGDRAGVYSVEGQCVEGIVTSVTPARVALREAHLVDGGRKTPIGVVTVTAGTTYMVQVVEPRRLSAVADAAEGARS